MLQNSNLLIISLFTLLIACGGEEQVKKTYDYERTDSLPPQYTTHLGNIRVSIEEVNLLYTSFRVAGYSYNNRFPNSPGKVSGYANTRSQAVNLGIYGADVNYALAFDQHQDVLQYMKSIAELSKMLGIEKAFDEETIKKLTETADTITDKSILLTRAYRHAQDQLHNEERASLVSMIVFGGWLEGIFISSSSLNAKTGTAEINQKVFENLSTFYDVAEMLNAFKEKNKSCAEILVELNEIKGTIEDLIRTRGNFSPDHIDKLHSAVSVLRNKQI